MEIEPTTFTFTVRSYAPAVQSRHICRVSVKWRNLTSPLFLLIGRELIYSSKGIDPKTVYSQTLCHCTTKASTASLTGDHSFLQRLLKLSLSLKYHYIETMNFVEAIYLISDHQIAIKTLDTRISFTFNLMWLASCQWLA